MYSRTAFSKDMRSIPYHVKQWYLGSPTIDTFPQQGSGRGRLVLRQALGEEIV